MRNLTRLLGSIAAPFSFLRGRRDAANIARLARHLSCSTEDARRVYELARVHGFGAAHRTVFGAGGSAVASASGERAIDPTNADRVPATLP
jgi:hypothetical protein